MAGRLLAEETGADAIRGLCEMGAAAVEAFNVHFLVGRGRLR